MNRLSDKVLTLDEAIEHAEECADNTPCGQNHKQLAEWLKELDRLKTTPIGNIYTLRQALVKAHTMLKVCDWPEGVYMQGVADLIKEIESALATPPRNCDVGTAEERMYRYNRLRDEINERYKRLGEIPPTFAFPTAFEWEDRPYEEGEKDGNE